MELALRLFLLALLLDSPLLWYQRVPLAIVCGLGLLLPSVLRDVRLWALITALTAWPLLWNWPFSDNHDYLRCFVALAVTLALGARSPERALQLSARLLLAGTFGFATLWKLGLSPDFVDGTFFRVTLLTDGRFADLAVLVGGASWETLDAFDGALRSVLAGAAGGWPGAFVEPPALRPLSLALTIFTGAIEAAITVAFLWPRFASARNPLLILFALTTFAFATVRGFGWLLMTLGLMQCEPRARLARAGYVASFFVIEGYRQVPWTRFAIDALGLS
jgi:hypothetical protein